MIHIVFVSVYILPGGSAFVRSALGAVVHGCSRRSAAGAAALPWRRYGDDGDHGDPMDILKMMEHVC